MSCCHRPSSPCLSPQLAGAAILGVGIWVKVDGGSIFGLLQKLDNAPAELSQILNVGYLLIAIGAILLVIGFLGCCGAVRESRCMLMLVSSLLLYGHELDDAHEPQLWVFQSVSGLVL